MVNVPTSLNNLKRKVDDLDVAKLKNVPVDCKKLSDVVANEVVKNTKFNTLKTTVKSLEKKVPDKITLIHINQYNSDKQNLEKKIGDVDKKIPDTSDRICDPHKSRARHHRSLKLCSKLKYLNIN